MRLWSIFWEMVSSGGWWWYILAGGEWWWMVVGGGGWWWTYFGWWWVVVDIFWLVVGRGGWWHSLVSPKYFGKSKMKSDTESWNLSVTTLFVQHKFQFNFLCSAKEEQDMQTEIFFAKTFHKVLVNSVLRWFCHAYFPVNFAKKEIQNTFFIEIIRVTASVGIQCLFSSLILH